MNSFQKDIKLIQSSLMNVSDQMKKFTGPPIVSGGTSDAPLNALAITAFNLFQKDPNDLFDLLTTLKAKYKSITHPETCDTKTKAKERQQEVKKRMANLKEDINALKKDIIKRNLKNLTLLFSKKKKYLQKEVKDLKAVIKTKQKELEELKTLTYEFILKQTISCEQTQLQKDHADFLSTVKDILHGFKITQIKQGDNEYIIFYMQEILKKQTSNLKFITYIIIPTCNKKITEVEFRQLARTIYDKNDASLQINRYLLLSTSTFKPVNVIHHNNTHACLYEGSSLKEKLEIIKALDPIRSDVLRAFTHLSIHDMKTYQYLYEHPALAVLEKKELPFKIEEISKELKTLKYEFKLLDSNIKELKDNEYFTYLVHFEIPTKGLNVFFVNTAYKFEKSLKTDEDDISIAFNNIIKYFVTSSGSEKEKIARGLWSDVHNYLSNKDPQIYLERNYYITVIPDTSLCESYPKIKLFRDSILESGGSNIAKTIWILCDDL
jgi:hypothetical protein